MSEEITTKCIGGGRIKHIPEDKYILIYGYSMSNLGFFYLNFLI